jgi:hypothetical protein
LIEGTKEGNATELVDEAPVLVEITRPSAAKAEGT